MSGLYPLSRMQQFDSDGNLLDGARLFLFTGGTTTPISGFKDAGLTTPHPNPILTDSAGRLPLIYIADGFYRQRLTTKNGSLIFDDDGIPVISTGTPAAGTTVDPNGLFKTRDIKIRFDDQPLAGYVRLNGRTIGSATSGATERANADTQSLYTELWTFANISVVGGKGGTAAGDFAANKPLTLPDGAGRGLFGMDDLGAGAQGRITAASITGPTVVGATGGQETSTLLQTNIPNYTIFGTAAAQFAPVTVSGSANVTVIASVTGSGSTDGQGSHNHSVSGTTGAMNSNAAHAHGVTAGAGTPTMITATSGTGSAFFGGSQGLVGIASSFTINSTNTDHTHPFSAGTSVDGNHAHNVTITGTASGSGSGSSSGTGTATVASSLVSSPSGGSGTAFTNMPPALLIMIYIRL